MWCDRRGMAVPTNAVQDGTYENMSNTYKRCWFAVERGCSLLALSWSDEGRLIIKVKDGRMTFVRGPRFSASCFCLCLTSFALVTKKRKIQPSSES